MGALPTLTTARLERSAAAKPGDPTSSSTMAGTRKHATGRSCSTVASQRTGSKRGRNQPLRPARNGPHTRRDPLVVANGDAVRKPSPSQRSGTRSTVDRLPWLTTTPLGAPVVPDVYMTSAASSSVIEAGSSLSSGDNKPLQVPSDVENTFGTDPRSVS